MEQKDNLQTLTALADENYKYLNKVIQEEFRINGLEYTNWQFLTHSRLHGLKMSKPTLRYFEFDFENEIVAKTVYLKLKLAFHSTQITVEEPAMYPGSIFIMYYPID